MKNGFKSFFELDKDIEFQKILNDHRHIREMKYKRVVIYGFVSCLGYTILNTCYKIFINKNNYQYNLLFRHEMRIAYMKTHGDYFKSLNTDNTYNNITELNKKYDPYKLDERSIKYLLRYINKNILFLNHLKRKNPEEGIKINTLNGSILRAFKEIIVIHKDKYMYRIVEILDLDINVFSFNPADVEIIAYILKQLDYHEESLRFLYYFENIVYYKVKRIIKELEGYNNPDLKDLK
jgi:hypothetical protein